MQVAIATTVIAAVLMQVLDTTIANVALPHIQASVGANQESIAWVLTSYIVATAIATPLTAWLEGFVGRRRLMLVAVAGFTASSVMCAASTSLTMIVVARLLQGAFGALILPLSQTVMLDSFPLDKQPKMMMIWSMGVSVAPVVGPLLGGWLTDQFNWRWVFLINLPIGILTFGGFVLFLPDKPAVRRKLDLVGFAYLAIALASLQLALDRGTQQDWFASTEILFELAIAIGCGWMFVVHSMTTTSPLFAPDLFRDRNFVICTIFVFVVMGQFIAGVAIVAPMLQNLYNYSVIWAGWVIMPRGAAMATGLMLAGRLNRYFDPRLVMAAGLVMTGLAQLMMSGFNLEMDSSLIIISSFLIGLGGGLMSLTLNVAVFSTLSPLLRGEGAAVFNLARNTGSAIAISLLSALLVRNMQTSHADLVQHFTDIRVPFLPGLEQQGAVQAIASWVNFQVTRQATMIAYIDDFWLMSWTAMALLPLIFLLKVEKYGSRPEPPPELAME